MSHYDFAGLHDFLINTPEGAIRKMLIDKKGMTDVHCNLLFKIARATNAQQFSQHFDKKDFPRVRTNPSEDKIKEKFWDECEATFVDRGILQPLPSGAAKVAA
jgi:hypothetical protein